MNDRHEDSCEKNMRYTHYYGVAQIRNHVDMGIWLSLHTFASVAQRRVNLLVRSGHSGGCKSTKDAERECHKLGDLRCKLLGMIHLYNPGSHPLVRSKSN